MNSNCPNDTLKLYEKDPFSKAINLEIMKFGKKYDGLVSVFQIGSSVQGVPILAIHIGWGDTRILIQATHHAREAITTILTLDQAKYLAHLYKENDLVEGISIRKLLHQISFYFVPLVNPDGADLVLNGASAIHPQFLGESYLDPDFFSSWKANINGVDLNENYPTRYPSNFLKESRGADGYPGTEPFSEPETTALRDLTEICQFAGTISYHSSGQEIFWYYNQEDEMRDFAIAKVISELTGYRLIDKESPNAGSGYKDWFIEIYQKPALTIEVAPPVGPMAVPANYYCEIWEQNKDVPIIFACAVYYYQ